MAEAFLLYSVLGAALLGAIIGGFIGRGVARKNGSNKSLPVLSGIILGALVFGGVVYMVINN